MKNSLALLLSAFLISNVCLGQQVQWLSQIRGSSFDLIQSSDATPDGKVASCGRFQGDLEVDGTDGNLNLPLNGETNGYLAIHNTDGLADQLLRLNCNSPSTYTDVKINSNGSLYITGEFEETADLDPGEGVTEVTSSPQGAFNFTRDFFISKLDPDGNLEWYFKPTSFGDGLPSALTLNPNGGPTFAAYSNDFVQFEFEGNEITYPDPGFGEHTYIFELDQDGTLLSHVLIQGEGRVTIEDMIYDENGNLYCVGTSINESFIDEDGSSQTIGIDENSFNALIFKISSNGNLDWSLNAQGLSSFFTGVEINGENEILVSGYFSGLFQFDGDNYSADFASEDDSRDICALKFSSDGQLVNAAHISGPFDDINFDIELDSNNDIYLSGSFQSGLDFDPSDEDFVIDTGVGAASFYLAKYSPDLDLGWVYWGGSGVSFGDQGRQSHVLSDGQLIFTGYFSGTMDFDADSDEWIYNSEGSTDGFVVKLSNPDILSVFSDQRENPELLFPNPTSDILKFKANHNIKSIQISNNLGQVVFNTSMDPNQNRVNLPYLPEGYYLVNFRLSTGGTFSQKLIIKGN